MTRDEPEKPGDCWDVRGLVMPCSRFASLHCRIGVIPREGVAINLPHPVVVIFVKLLQKLTVLCVGSYSKARIRATAPRSNINGCWSECYSELLIGP